MELPDLYFLFVYAPGAPPILVHRDPGGSLRELEWPANATTPGSLVLVGPGPAPLDGASLAFREAVRAGGGCTLPLARVLRRLGVTSGSGPDLLRRLGGAWDGVEDPRVFAREVLRGLADRLAELGSAAPLDPDFPGGEPDDPEAGVDASGSPGLRVPLRESVRDAPDGPGIYTFLSRDERPLYVGKAVSLRRRLASHLQGPDPDSALRSALVREAVRVRWEALGSELEALVREHLALRRESPPLNTQQVAHPRARGAWRSRSAALLLPSVAAGHSELCLVDGAGRFHWERVRRRARLPRGTWGRLGAFLAGEFPGWAPGEPDRPLEADLARELAEITLTWLAVKEPEVSRLDLTGAGPTRDLAVRLRQLLALDPRGGRVEVR